MNMRTIFPSIHTFAVNIFNSSTKGSICALTQFPNFFFFFKITLFFQNHVIFKITLFFFRIPCFSKLRYFSKSRYFQNYVIFSEFRAFQNYVIFQNFRVFKKFPVQSSPGIPHKNSMFFSKKFPV